MGNVTIPVAGISEGLLVDVDDLNVDVVDSVGIIGLLGGMPGGGKGVVNSVSVVDEAVLVLGKVVRGEVGVGRKVRLVLVVDDDLLFPIFKSSGHIPVSQGSTEQHPRYAPFEQA